jgi:periplasmic protein TonB
MTSYALHFPEQRRAGPWLLAAAVILTVHALLALTFVWQRRQPRPPELAPAISVSLAPVQSAAPELKEQDDLPVGPEMRQAEAAPPEPSKPEEQKVEPPVAPPPPGEHAEALVPKDEPQRVQKPKQEAQPPAPQTTAPPKSKNLGQFTQAASNAYAALIVGHLERYKRYPAAAHNAVGKTTVRFTLNRDGKVVDAQIVQSSGNSVLDQEALAIVHRADPFPKFPAAKPQAQDTWLWPMSFDRATRR